MKKIYFTEREAKHLLQELDIIADHLESKALYVRKKREQMKKRFDEFSE